MLKSFILILSSCYIYILSIIRKKKRVWTHIHQVFINSRYTCKSIFKIYQVSKSILFFINLGLTEVSDTNRQKSSEI